MIDSAGKKTRYTTENYPSISYTSRDYASIFDDLIESIPLLTKAWTSRDENDPGIVIIKLISMLGDMLSYNLDVAALEVYPDSVTQRKNAAQIFGLIGYKMHWYRSAVASTTIYNNSQIPATVPRFTRFSTRDGKITYTNMEQLELPVNSRYSGNEVVTDLVQGIPNTPSRITDSQLPSNSNDPWYSIYNYNVSSLDISDNKIYFNKTNVDESNIILIDNDSETSANEWRLVDNIALSRETGKIFEFGVDELDRPYIRLPGYWNQKYPSIDKFKLFFIESLGEDGEIIENALTTISTAIVGTASGNNKTDVKGDISIINRESSYGHYPETASEAKDEAYKYANTIDTLVTLDDFTRFVSRLEVVAKCIATDCTTDPSPNMRTYTVKIYVVRKDAYSTYDDDGTYDEGTDDVQKANIITEIQSKKLMPLKVIVAFEDEVDFFNWTVGGEIYLREPVTLDKSHDLLVKINRNLRYYFGPEFIGFGEAINYVDVIDVIMGSDPLIKYVDLDPLTYSKVQRNIEGNPTGYSISMRKRILNSSNNGLSSAYIDEDGVFRYTNSGEPIGYTLESSHIPNRIFRDEDNKLVGALVDLIDEETGITRTWIEKWVRNEGEGESQYPVYEKTSYYVEERRSILLDDIDTGAYVDIKSGIIYGKDNKETVYSISSTPIEAPSSSSEDPVKFYEIIGRYDYHTGYYYNSGNNLITDNKGTPIVDNEGNIVRVEAKKSELTGRYTQKWKQNEDEGNFKYEITLGLTEDGKHLDPEVYGNNFIAYPLTPGSVSISFENGQYVAADNTSGRLVDSQGLLNGMGTIDYNTAKITFETNISLTSPMTIYFRKNNVTMAKYYNLSPTKFNVSNESIKQS